jgi:hypothetical protein
VPVGVPHEPDHARRDAALEVDELDALVVLVHGQERSDADSDPGADEPLDGPVVVGAEHERRSAPARAEPLLDLLHRVALVEPDEGLERDLLQRRGSLQGRERRARGDEENERVVQQLDRLVRAGSDGQGPEGQVELAALDELEELALVDGLAEDDLDVRARLGEAPQQRRQHAGPDALERPDAEPARVSGLERSHVGLRREHARLDRVRVTQQDAAGLGQRDRARAAWALDETEPDDALESRDLLRDGGLRVAETLGGAPERALVGDRLQRDEMAEVEAVPAIRLHDRMVPDQRLG